MHIAQRPYLSACATTTSQAAIAAPRSTTAARRAFGTMALGLSLLVAGLGLPAMAAPNTTYSQDGVSFEHPAGWKVTEDSVAQDETRLRSIDLEGPDESVVTFMFSPFLKDQNIGVFAATTARNREEGAKGGDGKQQISFGASTTVPITRNVAGQESKGVSQRFEVRMLGQKLPHEARFFKVNLGGTTAIIMTQVATESAKSVEPGFTMALETLRYGSSSKR